MVHQTDGAVKYREFEALTAAQATALSQAVLITRGV
jgi:hypothetical protein